ncbi:hypothetical protein AB7C87_21100 [Natrarchaeobius sp. A-rgal3]|uniref:hypothetical protein n=1 Tax=Natrarchaeobius versutus TaxID=1679078 RepID=UPI003510047C
MYDRTFGTDWEHIDDREEVVRRAFALGVAARLGKTYPGELDRLESQTETSYDRSFVDLAYQKGRNEARQVQESVDEDETVWNALVEGRTDVEAPDRSDDPEFDDPVEDIFENTTIPEALRRVDIDSRPDDSTDRVGQPTFLDRLNGGGPATGSGGDRSVFGRSLGSGPRDDDHDDRNGESSERNEDDDPNSSADGTTGSNANEGRDVGTGSDSADDGNTDRRDSDASKTDER